MTTYVQGLELAESYESQCAIDILIGLDHFWDIVTGETIHGHSGQTVIDKQQVWLASLKSDLSFLLSK